LSVTFAKPLADCLRHATVTMARAPDAIAVGGAAVGVLGSLWRAVERSWNRKAEAAGLAKGPVAGLRAL
jgi:hypothetical protein